MILHKIQHSLIGMALLITTVSCGPSTDKNNSSKDDSLAISETNPPAKNKNEPGMQTNESLENLDAKVPAEASLEKNRNKSAQALPEDVKAASVNHSAFDKLLKTYVSTNGSVNYAGFSKEKGKIQDYIKSLGDVKVSDLSKNEKLAFWINAYNAITIDQILRNYPLKSIQNIAGGKVWDQPLPYKLDGKSQTLNQIEKKTLLGTDLFDARIHFAVNCAAVSCPTLINKAYTADNIQTLLTQNTKAALSDPAFNKISTSKASISSLFNWYKTDFEKAEGSVVNFINKYSTTKINNNTPINYLDYNWNLNGK